MYGKVKVIQVFVMAFPCIAYIVCPHHPKWLEWKVYLTIVCACLPGEVTPSSLSSHSQTWLLFTSIMTGTMSSWQLIVGFWWEVINSTSGRVLASVRVRACVKIATKQLSWRLMGKDHVLPKDKVKIFIDRRHGLLRLPGMNTGLQGVITCVLDCEVVDCGTAN